MFYIFAKAEELIATGREWYCCFAIRAAASSYADEWAAKGLFDDLFRAAEFYNERSLMRHDEMTEENQEIDNRHKAQRIAALKECAIICKFLGDDVASWPVQSEHN